MSTKALLQWFSDNNTYKVDDYFEEIFDKIVAEELTTEEQVTEAIENYVPSEQ